MHKKVTEYHTLEKSYCANTTLKMVHQNVSDQSWYVSFCTVLCLWLDNFVPPRRQQVPSNRKLKFDNSENCLQRMRHHIKPSCQVSNHSHLRFLRKTWRKIYFAVFKVNKVPSNRKLMSDGHKSLLQRTIHHAKLSCQVSNQSHLRFLRKAWRKFSFVRTDVRTDAHMVLCYFFWYGLPIIKKISKRP